ncbi:sensory rhodopsin transducer [Paradesulfitobacterium ferrireducens]|uniref:sensory rhodopsin transducer n=1 Tax=Paradesulfitobacterium ferrireducens TaxID=2816476 RepID=UPI001A8D49A3|nr:sensory rhodopsin transducer [Paradesulfitobacterium ferrireducens]
MGKEGAKVWFIPDAYLPSSGKGEKYEGHEAICVLNTTSKNAALQLSFYFSDHDPWENIVVVVPAKRSKHIRLDHPEDLGGTVIPRDVPYGIKIESDTNVSVQYSRLDVAQPNFTLMTTIPYYEE